MSPETPLSALADGRRTCRPRAHRARRLFRLIAKLREERFEFVTAAVNVADDVERSVFAAAGRSRAARARSWPHSTSSSRIEHEDVPESLALQPSQRPPELRALLPDHVRAEVAVGSALVPLLADLLRQVEDNGHRDAVELTRDLDERLARFGLDVRGVNDGQPAQRQPLAGDFVQQRESLRPLRRDCSRHPKPAPGRNRRKPPPWGGNASGRRWICRTPDVPIRTTRLSLGIWIVIG